MWTGSKRGSALLTVLWLTAALSAIGVAVATNVRGETERAGTNVDDTKSYFLATGAIQRAALRVMWGAPFFVRGMPAMDLDFPAGSVHVEIMPETARLSGINTDAMIVWANSISGGLAALAAILWSSKLGSAAPETGDNWLIISFAVAIIGGTGLAGGVISTAGLLMGATIFMLIKYALVELRTNDYYANSFLGGLILLAIVVDRLRESHGRSPRRYTQRMGK